MKSQLLALGVQAAGIVAIDTGGFSILDIWKKEKGAD